jgi:hypothetical protein
MGWSHRVDRVLGFFLVAKLGPPHSLTRRQCVPPLFGSGGTLSLAGEGVGESQFGRVDKHCGTLGIYNRYFVGGALVDALHIFLFECGISSLSWSPRVRGGGGTG